MSTLEENKRVVSAFLEATRVGDTATFLRLADPAMESWIPPSCEKVLGYPTLVKGAEQCRQARAASRGERYSGEVTYLIRHLLADGDAVAAFMTIRTATTGHTPYENDYVFFFRLRDGQIVEWGEYLDTAHAFQQFGFNISRAEN